MPRNKKAAADQVPVPVKDWPGVEVVEDRCVSAVADYNKLHVNFSKEAHLNPIGAVEWSAGVLCAQEARRIWQCAANFARQEGRGGLARFADGLLRDLLMHTRTHRSTSTLANGCDEMRHVAAGQVYEAVRDILLSYPEEA